MKVNSLIQRIFAWLIVLVLMLASVASFAAEAENAGGAEATAQNPDDNDATVVDAEFEEVVEDEKSAKKNKKKAG